MKIYEFLILDEESRYQIVFDKGVHIALYSSSKYIYHLYALDNFYVEILYDPITLMITGHLPFKHGIHLEKYLPDK
ncbi:hypothetical protein FMM05_19375 [Flavobacterium zepuense]|uniref:Uncharacterized protein n=1 Tax=Flavobacterium zepuense TaxID=2593302 RepID=A0A552UUR1_9FLAO|nr:hypothetical protein [Flavobacterium zepuense]TRW21952.1 hypothetical protein FMM05_19375 [Flavobacterium zepuense]